MRDALKSAGLESRARRLPTRAAGEDELGRVHRADYIALLSREMPGRSGAFDEDTFFSERTWEAALTAAGATIDVSRAVLSGEAKRGLALVRPPGHHAEADAAMGFCFLNNVAIAAACARAEGAARVAIVDWDVHHGNGIQNIFYDDPSVMYISCHQYPLYPGTGAPTEVGGGEAKGTTLNVGLPAGSGDREYAFVCERLVAPALRRFKPDLLLISAGFDAHVDDPLASMRVTVGGYRSLADTMCALADELCEGRVVAALEGGYDLGGLATGVVAYLDAFDDTRPGEPLGAKADGAAVEIAPGAAAAVLRTESAHAAFQGGSG